MTIDATTIGGALGALVLALAGLLAFLTRRRSRPTPKPSTDVRDAVDAAEAAEVERIEADSARTAEQVAAVGEAGLTEEERLRRAADLRG